MFNLFYKLSQFFLPPVCCICHNNAKLLCDKCNSKIQLKLYNSEILNTSHYYLTNYNPTIKTFIHNLKYQHQSKAASTLKPKIATSLELLLKTNQFNYWVPIPYHPFKIYQRGYNVISLLFEEALKAYGINKINVLHRHSFTKPLANQTKHYRKNTIKNSISIKKEFKKAIQSKHILLVDDIVTTQATMKSCITELMANHVSQITCLSLIKV